MKIPMLDLQLQYESLRHEIEPEVLKVLSSAQYVMGPNVRAFETECAEYLGVEYALGVASGTDALHLALRACGVGPGDEVITPSFTFIATVEAILYCGATPVFADIEPDSFHMNLSRLEELLTPRTKALMPVHLYGNPMNMTELMAFAGSHGLKVIEDCAQSFGSTWKGRQTGSFGDMGCYSFYPTKNLSCFGDGGLLVTRNEELYQECVALRNHGSFTRYHHEKLGYNSRLDEVQAAILRVKLRHLDGFNQARRQAAETYTRLLSGHVATPAERTGGKHIYHQYTLRHRKRDLIQQALQEAGIASAIYYPIPIHRQAVFNHAYDHLELPFTECVTQCCLSLPISPEITGEQIETICGVIRQVTG